MAEFPNVDNVDVWRYKNEFDYDRYKPIVRAKMCNVPWCGDYDNVVDFEGTEARDAYLDGLAGATVSLETIVNALPDTAIKVPVPATSAQLYNYLVLDLPPITSAAQPIEYAGGARVGRYLYFITGAQQLSPSSTKLFLSLDVWQTYIYSMRFDYIMLARGHAPVAAVSAEEYLADPVNHTAYLMAPDSNYSNAIVPRASRDVVLNGGDQFAVFATSADLDLGWGDAAHPRVPAIGQPYTQSAPCDFCYAVDARRLEPFLKWLKTARPWFLDTVSGLFFVSRDLVSVASTRVLGGVEVYTLDAVEISRDLLNLDIEAFGYPERARRYAKLYTYPYAQIAVTNADGEVTRIRVEGTRGYLKLNACASITMPWTSIDAHLIGIGAEDARVMEFNTANTRYRTYQGGWYHTVKSYGIPVWSIAQAAYDVAGYRTAYSREQAKLEADTSLANATASADTAKTNADNSAANMVANNAITVAANSANTATSNAAAADGVHASNANLSAATSFDIAMSSASYQANMTGLAVTATNNTANAAATAVGQVTSGIISAATGNVGGIASSIAGLGSTAVGWATANASNAVSQSNNDLIYNATISAAEGKTTNATEYNTHATNITNDAHTDITNTNNAASTSTTGNNANLTRTNAANTRNTAVANATRSHDVAIAGIQANWNESGVAAPVQQGTRKGGEHAATRPLLVSATIETQPDGAILQAASDFARYGYALNQEWKLKRLQVMRHFSYWQCSEVWCSGEGDALEGVQLAIKNIMINGTTVWSDPDEIGKVSIYDN